MIGGEELKEERMSLQANEEDTSSRGDVSSRENGRRRKAQKSSIASSLVDCKTSWYLSESLHISSLSSKIMLIHAHARNSLIFNFLLVLACGFFASQQHTPINV